jgi:hypothetical protein
MQLGSLLGSDEYASKKASPDGNVRQGKSLDSSNQSKESLKTSSSSIK